MSKHQNVPGIMDFLTDKWSLEMVIFLLLPRGNVEQKLVLLFVLLSFDDKLIWFDLARDCRTACEG
jgi:hypothetical protein